MSEEAAPLRRRDQFLDGKALDDEGIRATGTTFRIRAEVEAESRRIEDLNERFDPGQSRDIRIAGHAIRVEVALIFIDDTRMRRGRLIHDRDRRIEAGNSADREIGLTLLRGRGEPTELNRVGSIQRAVTRASGALGADPNP